MAGEQDRRDHRVAEIRAVRDAGGREDRAEDGAAGKPGRRRARGDRTGARPEVKGSAREPGGTPPAVCGARRAEALDGARVAGTHGRRREAAAARLGTAGRPRGTGGSAPPWGLRMPRLAGLERIVGLRRLGLSAALGALWVLGGCGGGVSGEIGQACITSGREAASRQLCSCVQGVANQTLSPTDQRRVARFFGNPDEAEAVRASDAARDEAFWDRFRNFTDTAEAICG